MEKNNKNFLSNITYYNLDDNLIQNNEKYVCTDFNDNIKLILEKINIDDFKIFTEKGDCSTNSSIDMIVDGRAYNSHAITFYLYNYSALKIIENYIDKNSMANKVFLELGCNNGYVPRLLNINNFKFKKYYGVDFDYSFILNGLKKFDSNLLFPLNFLLGDFNKPLVFENRSIDFIYFQEAFDHCRDKYFYSERLLSELNRILSNDGLLYITLIFEHKHRDLYHWDHNYIWSKKEFENVIVDYFDIINFNSLLTFEQTLKDSTNINIKKIINNWPIKLSKQICASFVSEDDSAVGSYLLRRKKC